MFLQNERERGKMGRNKIDLKKIEEERGRNITFSRRWPGLIKKAYELSVLSASDVVVITRHPLNNKLCYFSHPKRAKDILIRFLNMPDDVRKVRGQEFRERFVIPNKDSLIAKLKNCEIQEVTEAAEEMSIEQENSRATTSGDDSRSIQHTEVINPQEFPQQILDYQRFYHTATPMTPEQLFDEYGEKLKVILSHIQQRQILLQQQESMMQTNAFFANLQLQQPFQHNVQVQQQMQPQAHDSMQFQPQWPTIYWNNNRVLLSTEQSLQAPTQTAQVVQQEQERTGEQYFNQMELSTGLTQPQATSSHVILSAPNNSWGSTYSTAGPSNYFHQQSFGDGANNGLGLGQYDDKPNFNNWLKQ